MFELEVYPACLSCMWRDLRTDTVCRSDGTHRVEACEKAPVCKRIQGQKRLTAGESKMGGTVYTCGEEGR